MRLEEIQKRYNISVNEPEEIKAELKKRLKECHPDNNANFDSDYFMQLKGDLDYIEELLKKSNSNERLKLVNEVAQLISEVVQLSDKREAAQSQKEKLEKELSISVDNQIMMIKKRRRVTKYSSASILAIITFLWLFPRQAVEHPLMQVLFGDIMTKEFTICITGVWLLTLGITSSWWLIIIREERKEKEMVSRMKLESAQNEIFMNFLDNFFPEKQFTKLEFMDYLSDGVNIVTQIKRRTFLFRGFRRFFYRIIRCFFHRDFGHFFLQEEVVQNMADIILLRAKEYGIIKTVKSRSLIECYEIISDEE